MQESVHPARPDRLRTPGTPRRPQQPKPSTLSARVPGGRGSATELLALQRLAGNRAVGTLVQPSGPAGPGGTGREPAATPTPLQRDFLTDAWNTVSAAGPAVANATQLVGRVATNPSMLPVVMGAIAWESIPESLKGPLIDQVLRACLAAARTVEFPGPPGVPIGTIVKHVAIGALERALSYPTGMKVRVADRMAKVVLNPSPEFSLGFLMGLVEGLWDGLTGPFVLLWDLAKLGYAIQSAQLRFLSNLAHAETRKQMGRDVEAALAVIEPRINAAIKQLISGKGDPRQIMNMIQEMVNAALRGVESLGASLSDALLRFMNRPDKALGEGVGYVTGTVTFEVLLLVLTEGGYTALKEAVQGLRVVVRLAEAGAQAAEALAPARAALTAFTTFAKGNRALGPLAEAVEAAFGLLMKFLRMSYGLGGAGGAARAGEHGLAAGERAASREIRIADTAMHETHEITMLADGRLIRCSDRCLELTASITERARLLAAERMPGESARLMAEAEQIAQEARLIKADTALSDADRAARESALMSRAASLERQTAAAEREALNRMAAPATRQATACRDLASAHAGDVPALRGFDGQISQLEAEIAKTRTLLDDPEMRELAREELRNLERQAADLEADMRRLVPEGAAPLPGQRRYDPSPKHAEGGFGTLMDLDDATARRVLNEGITGPNGKQVYGFHDGKIYEFQPDNVGGFHGYPVPGTEVPNQVLRQWRDAGVITDAEYRRFVRGAD